MSSADPRVGIVMGSKSDWPVVEAARKILDDFGVGSVLRRSVLVRCGEFGGGAGL